MKEIVTKDKETTNEENEMNSPTVLSCAHTHTYTHKQTLSCDRFDSKQFDMALPCNNSATATLKQDLDDS